MANPNWQPGISGNPKGRPPKARALTEILKRAGSQTLAVDGHKVAKRRIVAGMLWDIATTGRTKYADGKELVAGAAGWLDVVKFLYAQIDGPPRSELDVQVQGALAGLQLDDVGDGQ
jgi:hypothetical protein